MKIAAALSTSVLTLFLGTSVLAVAQHGHEGGHDRPQGNGHHEESSRHAPPQHGGHHESHDAVQRGPVYPPYRGRGPAQLHEVRTSGPGPHYVRQDIWERQRAQHWKLEHHSWHERGGYHGYRIPEDRFRAHFGRGHWFRVHDVPVLVVDGSPRFQFGGFWFDVVDPCPETWSPAWYRTDDVYVDYVNDGYYMYNRRHPGIAIAINVSL